MKQKFHHHLTVINDSLPGQINGFSFQNLYINDYLPIWILIPTILNGEDNINGYFFDNIFEPTE
jgi:hypothetical protein